MPRRVSDPSRFPPGPTLSQTTEYDDDHHKTPTQPGRPKRRHPRQGARGGARRPLRPGQFGRDAARDPGRRGNETRRATPSVPDQDEPGERERSGQGKRVAVCGDGGGGSATNKQTTKNNR